MINWVLTILSFSLLFGAGGSSAVPECRVVTEISIEWQEDDGHFRRVYTEQEKMNKCLLYLRTLDPVPLKEKPEGSDATLYMIRLQKSDGSAVIYRQWGNRFFQEASGRWHSVDPEKATRFALILAAVPSDF